MSRILLSKIGPGQLTDVERSRQEVHDDYFRTCTVLQGSPPLSDIGDTFPHRMYNRYGREWEYWNRQFVVQVAGCPFNCWYCYVDNFRVDWGPTIQTIVQTYVSFRESVQDLNVFHLMGGCPGKHAHLWKEVRDALDSRGLFETILLTDVILIENTIYGVKPWELIPHRTHVQVCLKGTNFQNFRTNTGMDCFGNAMGELSHYLTLPESQVHFTLVEWDEKDKSHIAEHIGSHRIDWLKVKEYEVVKNRRLLCYQEHGLQHTQE